MTLKVIHLQNQVLVHGQEAWAEFLALLLKTGQTTQYNSKEDDGYYEKGLSKEYAILTTGQYSGTTNITINSKTHALSNNCVIDDRTGLMWARYVPTADIGPDNDGKLFYLDAVNSEDVWEFIAQANAGSLGGYDDWKIPNVEELESLLDYATNTPAIDTTVFPSTPADNHWTSTTDDAATTQAEAVRFSSVRTTSYAKATSKFYCRLVRGGPN